MFILLSLLVYSVCLVLVYAQSTFIVLLSVFVNQQCAMFSLNNLMKSMKADGCPELYRAEIQYIVNLVWSL